MPNHLNSWVGILDDHIIRPLFTDENRTSNSYLQMLKVIDPLINQALQCRCKFARKSTHFSTRWSSSLLLCQSTRFLNWKIFWTMYSPKRTTWMESKIVRFDASGLLFMKPFKIQSFSYTTIIYSRLDRITSKTTLISPAMLKNVRQVFDNRFYLCTEPSGEHFEQLIR